MFMSDPDDIKELEMYRDYFILMLTKGMGWTVDSARDWSVKRTLNHPVILTESPGFWLASVLIEDLNRKNGTEAFWALHPDIADALDIARYSETFEWNPSDATINAKMATVEALVAEFISKQK